MLLENALKMYKIDILMKIGKSYLIYHKSALLHNTITALHNSCKVSFCQIHYFLIGIYLTRGPSGPGMLTCVS